MRILYVAKRHIVIAKWSSAHHFWLQINDD